MNFKRNLLIITSALVSALALTGCEFDGPTEFLRYNFIEEVEDKHEDVIGNGYTKFGKYSDYTIDRSGFIYNLGDQYKIFRDNSGLCRIPSEGHQNLLVVPVKFEDYGVDKLNLTEMEYIRNLNKAFFGKSKNNAYVSVSEYFNKSSYGKLQLDGKVCDTFYTFKKTVKQIKEDKIDRDYLVKEVYPDVLKWFKETYPAEAKDFEISGLKDGKDIPIYLVYTYPISEDTELDPNEFFWAYTFGDVPMSWSSSSFMYLQYGEPDAHTYIHETGHLLGLTDYYPTSAKNGETDKEVIPEPAARIDMMDCSIGDETSFSKMYLNWSRPYYAYDNSTISINSFTEYGDTILVANSWNKTVFDEYFLVEFYTPTYLNTYDVSAGNSQAKLPTVPGIKIYHVDSRLAFIDGNRNPVSYCSLGLDVPTPNNIYYAHDNNTYTNPNDFQKNYIYSLILNNSKTSLATGCAIDKNLFRAGDVIDGLTMNDGSALNYKITIESVEFSRATIKIEKKA